MEPAIAVVTDVHHPSATRAVPIRDVELPGGEIGILGPVVGHRADLPGGLRSVDRADQPRGYTCRSRVPSLVLDRCFLTHRDHEDRPAVSRLRTNRMFILRYDQGRAKLAPLLHTAT